MRAFIALLITASAAFAEPPQITDVKISGSNGTYRFDVTLTHPDTGWDHYADGWEIRTLDGAVLGTRTLFHPHVNEQPFTRALSGVAIDAQITQVAVFARCNVDGWAATPVIVTLP